MKPLQLNRALSYGHSSLQHPSSLPMTEEAFRETRYHWQSPLAASDWLSDRDPCPHSGVGALCSSGPHPKELLPMQSWELPLHTSGNVFCSSVEGRKVFLDGVSVGGSCDPLADGAKSCSSASVKGQPWRIQPKAEGVGAFVPLFLFFKNLGKL